MMADCENINATKPDLIKPQFGTFKSGRGIWYLLIKIKNKSDEGLCD